MATQTDAVARLYASSLYELADNAGGSDKVQEVGDELEQVCELARSDSSFREFLASPVIENDARSEAIQKMFGERVTDLTLRFMLVLNAKGRLGHLETVTAAYDELVQEAHGKVEVDVWTASPLGSDQLDMLKGRVKDALGREPIFHQYTDESMIGGMRMRVGDQLIDGSVSTRLRRLRESLLRGGSLRERMGSIIEAGDGA